jgi:sugar lactone lactonase YvrE
MDALLHALTYTLMNAASPSPVTLASLAWHGQGLVRPECVLATRNGSLYSADWRGGVAHLRPDGSQALYQAALPGGLPLRPNGIALLADGSFLLTQLGEHDGGVYRLWRDGRIEPWLMEVDGQALPPTNFVLPQVLAGAPPGAVGDPRNANQRTWVTVSTRRSPRALGYRRDGGDGFIVRVDGRGAAVVADDLGYTNEVAVHPSGQWLYVNETFARRLSRFALNAQGDLGPRETVTEFGPGTFPDGLVFDEAGHAWVVSIVSNRVIRVAPDGQQTLWLEDADEEHLVTVEAAFEAGQMGRPHLDNARSQALRNISSLAFAGPDRRSLVLGCLLGTQLASLPMPVPGVAGAKPVHWEYP